MILPLLRSAVANDGVVSAFNSSSMLSPSFSSLFITSASFCFVTAAIGTPQSFIPLYLHAFSSCCSFFLFLRLLLCFGWLLLFCFILFVIFRLIRAVPIAGFLLVLAVFNLPGVFCFNELNQLLLYFSRLSLACKLGQVLGE